MGGSDEDIVSPSEESDGQSTPTSSVWERVKLTFRTPHVASAWLLVIGSAAILLVGYDIIAGSWVLLVYGIPLVILWKLLSCSRMRNREDTDWVPIVISVVWVFLLTTYLNFFPMWSYSVSHSLSFFLSVVSVPVFLLGPSDFWKKSGLERSALNRHSVGVSLLGGVFLFPILLLGIPLLYESYDYALLLVVISSCILPSIFEELLCRGLIQDSLSRRWGTHFSAITASSFIFGLFHISKNYLDYGGLPVALLVALGVHMMSGMLLGTMRALSDSLIPSVLVHIAHNLLALSVFDSFIPHPLGGTLASFLIAVVAIHLLSDERQKE